MRRLPIRLLGALLLNLLVTYQLNAQEKSGGSTTPSRTFRPVVRGTQYAVSSMKLEATRAASRILESGGNAFDAIVAGQAVLALVNPESNGLAPTRSFWFTTQARNRCTQSMPREPHQSWRRSIGTTRTTAARFPTVTDCFPRHCPALSMRGMYCSIAGAP